MNISPKLQLNLHPKDGENLSLVTALTVKLANDESCITNEEPPSRKVATAWHTLGFDTSMCRATSTERTMPFSFWSTNMASR